jgi:putative two-component system response regulator
MLDCNPLNRPVLPVAIAHALTHFSLPPARTILAPSREVRTVRPARVFARRVLVVEQDENTRRLRRRALEAVECVFIEASDGPSALAEVETRSYDVVLVGEAAAAQPLADFCQRLRERSASPYLQILVLSGRAAPADFAGALQAGADDLLCEPLEAAVLAAKVGYALRQKESRDRADALAEQLLAANRQLQQSLDSRGADLYEAHNAMLFAMAKMAESRDGETPGHLQRLQGYTRALALEAAKLPPWSGLVDERFLAQLERCVPLHDIGKIGLPEDILLKPASLSAAERALVETHPLIGDRILEALGREHGTALDFLGFARGIVRHHHERFDGRGYPDKLCRDEIPAAARLTAVADVYDALRRERLHKPAMSHSETIAVLLNRSEGQFDPMLLVALEECQGKIEQIYREIGD